MSHHSYCWHYRYQPSVVYEIVVSKLTRYRALWLTAFFGGEGTSYLTVWGTA